MHINKIMRLILIGTVFSLTDFLSPLSSKEHSVLFLPFCERGTPQLTLLIKIQEYCYDNMNFMKVFHKIVLLFYKSRYPVVLSEYQLWS